MTRIRALILAVAVVAAVSTVGAPANESSAASNAGDRAFPPTSRAKIAAQFDPALEKLHLRVSRYLLQNPTTYKKDPRGTHFALYVEPVGFEYDLNDYVTNFTKLARMFVPLVFETWPGIKSFDVCQEPPRALDDRPSPPPVTQIFVHRDALDRVEHWRQTNLSALLAAVPSDEAASASLLYVYFHPDTQSTAGFKAAAARADFDPSAATERPER